ncbi:MAG: rhomboid family intramembrane serine protease [Erysipelotrichaceae bacterium]|nr:rhomboid family intramembrane serine protease [Erysipelotrichaceae bacterium]
MYRYFCTISLIVVNVIVFILIRTGKLDEDDLLSSYHLVFNRREYQRIITAGFTHSEPVHLLMNMLSLYNVGTFVESYFGHFYFLLIYFASMILGKLLALYIRHSNRDDYTMSRGASGAISGLLGSYFLVILHYYGFSGMSYLMRPMVSLLMISMMPGVDGTSHFSSMAVGMAITYLFFLF